VAIVIVIFGVIATFAIPAYYNVLENAKAEVCEGNLSTLLGALESYGLEDDQMPGSLGQLKKEHLEKGWAKTFKERGLWRTKLAYFLVDFDKRGLAYAQASLVDRYLGGVDLVCPMVSSGANSYGLNTSLVSQGMPYDDGSISDYESLAEDGIVIADSDSAAFAGMDGIAERHYRRTYGLGVSKGKDHYKCKKNGDKIKKLKKFKKAR